MFPNFVKGDSRNLPKVDEFMVAGFFSNNEDYMGVEMRGNKMLRSSGESYGDNAVGYVQVMRENGRCIVKGRITPEHKVHKKCYSINVIINENEDFVEECKCEDCPASEGGCKHAVAFLMWLYRRSTEPSCTSVKCYWKKSKLSTVGQQIKFVTAQEVGNIKRTLNLSPPEPPSLFREFIEEAKKQKVESQILSHVDDNLQNYTKVGMHNLCLLALNDRNLTASEFIDKCKNIMTETYINNVERKTRGQAGNTLWFEMRYGRITASILYEAAHCKTTDGSLVNKVMGQKTKFFSKAVERGKKLEEEVISQLGKKINKKISKCGLFLNKDYPMLGASPDGIIENFVIEVKCPALLKTMSDYIGADGKINKKYYTQLQIQMYVCKKKISIFVWLSQILRKQKNLNLCMLHIILSLQLKYWVKLVNFGRLPFIPS